MGMDRTLYFCLNSLESGEDMIFLRMWEGALKCRLRFLLRSEVTNGLNFMLAVLGHTLRNSEIPAEEVKTIRTSMRESKPDPQTQSLY